jgi:DNA-binding NarL/FixJ family response regulator
MVRGDSAGADGSGSRASHGGPSPGRVRQLNASGGPRWRIVIAARPPLFSESLSVALRRTNIEIVGRAGDESEALELVRRTHPAVLLLDGDGFGDAAERVIRSLHHHARGTRILVLASVSRDEMTERALRLGAAGLVGKQETIATLARAIQAVARGELWANRRTTAHVVEILSEPAGGSPPFRERLTAREWEIAEAVGRGLRNREIARRLRISEKTVKSHLNNVFRKLQVENRFAAALYALDPGRAKAH